MTLRDLLALDVQNVVLNTEDFGEAITYTPKSGSGAVSINALIRRVEPDNREETNFAKFRAVRMWIANDATLGVVAPAEGDTVSAVLRAGQAAETGRVTAILLTNEGAHQLEVTGGS